MSDTTVAPIKATPITTTEVTKPAETIGSTASANPTNTTNSANPIDQVNVANSTSPVNPVDSINPINPPVSAPTEASASIAQGTPTPEQGKKLDVVA